MASYSDLDLGVGHRDSYHKFTRNFGGGLPCCDIEGPICQLASPAESVNDAAVVRGH